MDFGTSSDSEGVSHYDLANTGDKYFKILSREDVDDFSDYNGYKYNPIGFEWHN